MQFTVNKQLEAILMSYDKIAVTLQSQTQEINEALKIELLNRINTEMEKIPASAQITIRQSANEARLVRVYDARHTDTLIIDLTTFRCRFITENKSNTNLNSGRTFWRD